jgi:hypothetical protein
MLVYNQGERLIIKALRAIYSETYHAEVECLRNNYVGEGECYRRLEKYLERLNIPRRVWRKDYVQLAISKVKFRALYEAGIDVGIWLERGLKNEKLELQSEQ